MDTSSRGRPRAQRLRFAALAAGATLAVAATAHAAPENQAPPQIAGSLVAGTVATCNPGAWSGASGFEYRWFRGVVRADREIQGQNGPRLPIDRPAHAGKLACLVVAVDAAGQRSRSVASAERETRRGQTTVRITRVVPLPGIVRSPSPPFRLQRMRIEGVVGPPVFPGWQRFATQQANPQLGRIFVNRGRQNILPRGVSSVPVRNTRGRFQAIVHTAPGRVPLQVIFVPSGIDWASGRTARTVVLRAR